MEIPYLAGFVAALAPQNQIASGVMIGREESAENSDLDSKWSSSQERRALITMVVVMFAAMAVTFAVVTSGFAQPLPLTILSLLAIVGFFFLFATIAGHIRIGERLSDQHFGVAISDHLEQAIFITGKNGQLLWCNSAYRDLVGLNQRVAKEARDGNGKHSLKALLGNSKDVAEAFYRLSLAAEEGAFRSEDIACTEGFVPNLDFGIASVTPPPSQNRVLRVSVRPFVEGGKPKPATVEYGTLAQWTIEDITEHHVREKVAVAEINTELQRYQSLPIGVVVISVDGEIHYINAMLNDWIGRKFGPDHKGNRHISEIFSSNGATAILQAIRKSPEEMISADIDILDDNGRVMPVHVSGFREASTGQYALCVNKLHPMQFGQPTSNDLSDLIQRFFKSAPFGIAIIDTDGRITRTNSAFSQMVGEPIDEDGKGALMAKVLSRHVDPDIKEAIEAGLKRVTSGMGDIAPIDIHVDDEHANTSRVYMQPLATDGTSSSMAALYFVDVTEHKALEEQFAQSQKMEAVGKLAGGIAHDFNNVLTAIIGFSDLLLQTHRTTDPAHKDILNIKQSAERAAGLVEQLLAFSRRQTFQTEIMHLGDSISDWTQFLKRSIGEKVDLTIKSDRDLWLVKSDKTQIEQVITNLSVNARDAMPNGGKLTIHTRNIPERAAQKLSGEGLPLGEYVLIEVIDTGVGISDELKKKIFEPFFTTKEIGQGTGLGLSTVYGIVKQAGGYLFVDSEIGVGSTFRIYLPRYDGDDAEETVVERSKEKKERTRDLTGSGRVLLVEDEDVVRSFAVRALRRQGYEVLEAGSGAEALDVMKSLEGTVDIVVSDVVMPEMDGPTLLKELRKDNPDLKIIFVSGYPNEAFKQALGEEKFAFLPKPFSLPDLAEKVKEELAA